MHNPEYLLENETNHQISARRPYRLKINKKGVCRRVDFAVLADHRIKLKKAKREISP